MVLWYAMTVGTTWFFSTSQCLLFFVATSRPTSFIYVFFLTISSLLFLKASDVGLSSPWIWQSPHENFGHCQVFVELCQAPRLWQQVLFLTSFILGTQFVYIVPRRPVSCTNECILEPKPWGEVTPTFHMAICGFLRRFLRPIPSILECTAARHEFLPQKSDCFPQMVTIPEFSWYQRTFRICRALAQASHQIPRCGFVQFF